jgi:hypothetical protein
MALLREYQKERDRLVDLDVEGYIMLKIILKKWYGTGSGTGPAMGSLMQARQ